jgi:hypothetical protein
MKAKMINPRKPSQKQLKLRRLVEGAKVAEIGCDWCKAVRDGKTDSTAICKPTAPMCLDHRALSVEWSRWFASAPFDAPSIMGSITERGLEVARRQMLKSIMKEVA